MTCAFKHKGILNEKLLLVEGYGFRNLKMV